MKTLTGTLASAVADTGTFTVSYPTRSAPEIGTTDAGAFFGSSYHRLVMNQALLVSPSQFALTFGAASITVTNRSGATWPAGSAYTLQLDEPGKRVYGEDAAGRARPMARMSRISEVMVNMGAADLAVANGICASQSIAAGTAAGAINAVLNGALVAGGVAVLDVPRNVVGAWTTASIVTVEGYDEYGEFMVEKCASGAVFTGKKAFKRVTRIWSTVAITLATFGTGVVLGLPVFLPSAGNVIRELLDGVVATNGTIVAGLAAAGGSTATSADVRGTYSPAVAPDGAVVHQLILSLADPGNRGPAQFATP